MLFICYIQYGTAWSKFGTDTWSATFDPSALAGAEKMTADIDAISNISPSSLTRQS